VLAVIFVDLRLQVVAARTLSTPAQKLSGSMSVPGSASLLTKS
jgi:hypothetical protein